MRSTPPKERDHVCKRPTAATADLFPTSKLNGRSFKTRDRPQAPFCQSAFFQCEYFRDQPARLLGIPTALDGSFTLRRGSGRIPEEPPQRNCRRRGLPVERSAARARKEGGRSPRMITRRLAIRRRSRLGSTARGLGCCRRIGTWTVRIRTRLSRPARRTVFLPHAHP